MVKNKYNVYIDESGDEGIRKGSKYFILTALIVNEKHNNEIHFDYIKKIKDKIYCKNIFK